MADYSALMARDSTRNNVVQFLELSQPADTLDKASCNVRGKSRFIAAYAG
jgi:hypothetical protein